MIPPIKEPDLAPAGLALLVIFGLLIWYDRPVESARPFDPYAQHYDLNTTGYAYESWLWQDPFGFDLDSYTERNRYFIEFGDSSEKMSPRGYRIHKKRDVEPLDRKKESEDKKRETVSNKEEREGQCEYQLNEKKSDIKKTSTANTVKILAPLLKVHPNTTENKELRTRHRFAVIAGLIQSGYLPREPNHLHFCSSQENGSNKEYDMRWEHYSPESTDESDKDKPDIIVVWMNSEIFADNYQFISVLENLLESKETIENNVYVYDLNNILDQDRSAKITREINDINKNYLNGNIKLIKPAGTDETLIKKLTEELELRNVRESEVIIITEQDSENARALANNFCNLLSAKNKLDGGEDTSKKTPCEIRNVFYLKGLDAYQQILHKRDKNGEVNKPAARLSAIDLDIPPPLPIGPGQFDYFHRLAAKINDRHKEINLDERDSGIKAVGVFGSDFYDKLLILEALRAEMPHILVFTTDLDAQMLHSQYWPSTRNLVVASHFDLLLKEKDNEGQYREQSYQAPFPIFRDSQQTNIFYRTVETITNDDKRFDGPSPRIYEIGRNGPLRLDAAENERYRRPGVAQNAPGDQSWLQLQLHLWLQNQTNLLLSLLTGIIVSLIWIYKEITSKSKRLFIYLLFGTLLIFSIAFYFAVDKSEEHLSFTDGISLWPSIFIQIIAILMAFGFFVHGRKELRKNFDTLSKLHFKYYRAKSEPKLSKHVRLLLQKPRKLGKRLGLFICLFPSLVRDYLCNRNLLIRLPTVLPTVIFLFLSIWVYAFNDVNPSELRLIDCLALLITCTICYSIIHYKIKCEHRDSEDKYVNSIDFNSIKHWIEKNDLDKDSSIFERRLWEEYYHYGLIDHRVIRVVAMWLLFAIIETMLIYILPPWPLPCRGDASCSWASWAGVLSFTFVMLLLFFALDAVRLSFFWIKKLCTQHPLLTLTNRNTGGAGNDPLGSLEGIVTLVAERTQVVDRLIYYPMLCIMLLLFAKLTYFDNQEFPLSKGITFAASISLLFLSGFMLRGAAEQLKRSVIQKATDLGKEKEKEEQEQASKTIKRTKDICDGAFQPMFEQPVLRALLIILASIGLFMGEYLKLFE